MSSDSESPAPDLPRTEYTFDSLDRLRWVRKTSKEETTCTYRYYPSPDRFHFEHDEGRKRFVLTDEGGTAEHFRRNPTRYLVVKPDDTTGEMRPATVDGMALYIHLCREEREV
jgi:hypothetical protein